MATGFMCAGGGKLTNVGTVSCNLPYGTVSSAVASGTIEKGIAQDKLVFCVPVGTSCPSGDMKFIVNSYEVTSYDQSTGNVSIAINGAFNYFRNAVLKFPVYAVK